jgi:hypothetical protein
MAAVTGVAAEVDIIMALVVFMVDFMGQVLDFIPAQVMGMALVSLITHRITTIHP